MARWNNRVLPAVPVVDWSDPICSQQRAWWLGNGDGSRLVNLMAPTIGRGLLGSGVTRSVDGGGLGGRVLALDGGANAYVDLGTNDVVPHYTEPFAMHWLENVGSGYPTFPAVACFYPANNAGGQRFLMFRTDNASYNSLAFSQGSSTMRRAAGAPSLASSVGIWRQWIVSSETGVSNTTNSWRCWCDGVEYVVTAGSSLGGQTSQLNYLGWDGADNQWLGRMANVRVWRRALGSGDAARLFGDPWAGLPESDLILSAPAAAASNSSNLLIAF